MQTRWTRWLMIVVFCGLWLGTPARWGGLTATTTAYAQAAEGGADSSWDKNKRPETFWDYWRQGGPTMWPLLATAVWATAVLIELLLRLRRKVVAPEGVIQQVHQALQVKDYQKAWRIGRDNPTAITRILSAALEKLPLGQEAFENAALETASAEANVFRTKNAYVNLNATIAPLLGLFGTISGMIGAFNSMAFSGAVGDPSKLAGDIGEALVTTYAGLIIAIPALVCYYILGNRIKQTMEYVQGKLSLLIEEIDFDAIPEDLVIVAKDSGAGAFAAAGKSVAAAAKAPCPNCSKELTVGDKKCPHCSAELDWE